MKIFKCRKCIAKDKEISLLKKEKEDNPSTSSQDIYSLEKEIAYWKEKALNFKKFHI